jgi:aminoglycoside phosphotransferase (APT) family kinase protein
VSRPPFDVAALGRWLSARGLCGASIKLSRLGDGLSNLTYTLTDGTTTMVLRRPPPPPLPPGGNDMRREARILTALRGTSVPVPRVLAVAKPGDVMDVGCYLMEYLEGVVPAASLPAGLDYPNGRQAAAEAFIDVLAALHRLDWRGLGLDGLGRPDGFLARQLDRLPGLIAGPDGQLPGPFGPLRDRLRASLPPGSGAALLHGDYRFGNVMLAPGPPAAIAGVLDWELAGVGDPLADLGYTLATYAVPGEPLHALTALSALTLAGGFPGRDALAARYAERTGADLSALAWYEAFALFKLAVLFEYNRRKAGADPYYRDPALVAGLLAASQRRTADAEGAVRQAR